MQVLMQKQARPSPTPGLAIAMVVLLLTSACSSSSTDGTEPAISADPTAASTAAVAAEAGTDDAADTNPVPDFDGRTLRDFHLGVMSIVDLPDGQVASLGNDSSIFVWHPDEPTAMRRVSVPRDAVAQVPGLEPQDVLAFGSLALLDDGRLVAGGSGRYVSIIELDGSVPPVHHLMPGEGRHLGIVALADNHFAAHNGRTVSVWNASELGAVPVALTEDDTFDRTIEEIAVDAAGRIVVSSGNLLAVWDWEAGTLPEDAAMIERGGISSVTLMSDGRIAAGDNWGNVTLIDLSDGTQSFLDGPADDDTLHAVAELPDGRIAAGGYQGHIKVWELDSPLEPTIASGAHLESVYGGGIKVLHVLPDGRLLSGGAPGVDEKATIIYWENPPGIYWENPPGIYWENPPGIYWENPPGS